MATRPRDVTRLHITLVSPPGARRAARGLRPWLERVAPRRTLGHVTIALVGDRRMRALNRNFRGVDHPTDVLSFPAFAEATVGRPAGFAKASAGRPAAFAKASASRCAPTPRSASMCLGDIAIATGVAARQARAARHPLGTELRVLALHGLLHLLGFDHETDDGLMARTEATLRRAGNLPEGLIERAGPGRAAVPRSTTTPSGTTTRRPRR